MSKHARLSASQTKWWMKCSGAPAVCEVYHPERDESGHYAQMGTAAHKLGEECLSSGADPEDFLDRIIIIEELPGGDEEAKILRAGAKTPPASVKYFLIDDDMVDAVSKHVDYVRRRCGEMGLIAPLWAAMEAQGGDENGGALSDAKAVSMLVASGVVRLEKKVNPLPERDDTGGTGDVIIDAWPEELEVVDYKNGAGVFVDAVKNEQARSYGLGAMNEAGGDDYERVRCTIVQPRHHKSPPDGVMYEELTAKELRAWGDDLRLAATRVDDARSIVAASSDETEALAELDRHGLLSVGEDGSHCDYCKLKHHCPASLRKAQELAAADFSDEPAELEAPTGNNHLATILPWIPFLDSFCKSAMRNAEHALFRGEKVGDWKIVHGKGSGRKFVTNRMDGDEVIVVSNDMLADEISAEFELNRADLFSEPELKSGPQIEKLIRKGPNGESAASRKKYFSEKFLYSPEGKLSIAPGDDPRPAVEVDPSADFEDEADFNTE